MKELLIKVFYGSLGDHLLHSHLPRIAKEQNGYDKVFISNSSNYNKPSTKKFVWENNPYVDGFVDGERDHPYSITLPGGKNLLDCVADFYGLKYAVCNVEPEVYYNPRSLPGLREAVLLESNYNNPYGAPNPSQVEAFLNRTGIMVTHQMKDLGGGKQRQDRKIVVAPTIEEYCDIIASSKEFYCYTTGAATLAAALGKPVTVLYVDGVNKMFHHSKMHVYRKVD